MTAGLNPKDLVGAKKAPLSLVPPSMVIAVAEAMGNGAAKYGPFNWRDQPIQVRTYVEAALRHLYAFLDGQERAEDTGISHLAHAMAGLAILNDAIELGAIDDNRSKGPAADLLRAQDKSVNPGDLTLGPPTGAAIEEAWAPLSVLVATMEEDPEPYHDGPIPGPTPDVQLRGEWPADTRVGGLLTCCGQSEHPIDCPQWR